MLKTLLNMALGAIIFAGVSAAVATVGVPPPPGSGPGLQDGVWLNGLAGGQNFAYQYGVTAVGTTQATAAQVQSGFYLNEVDTSDSGGASGIALPQCYAGTAIIVYNNTAYTIDVYPDATNNPVTNAQDTINNGTSTTILTHARKAFTCAKSGVWAAG